ncbi:hypothetical protein Hypma_014578 [Hypsizygus marmoreus]|uniref:Uncharacterized protein n=1 Tax=Hypsizygus marmoreus TaxID=39966 RepID=A0A369JGQ3_HYPMA|nr:hypothetical protein Hypma_014578 [Hypsizygus marmoreus]
MVTGEGFSSHLFQPTRTCVPRFNAHKPQPVLLVIIRHADASCWIVRRCCAWPACGAMLEGDGIATNYAIGYGIVAPKRAALAGWYDDRWWGMCSDSSPQHCSRSLHDLILRLDCHMHLDDGYPTCICYTPTSPSFSTSPDCAQEQQPYTPLPALARRVLVARTHYMRRLSRWT